MAPARRKLPELTCEAWHLLHIGARVLACRAAGRQSHAAARAPAAATGAWNRGRSPRGAVSSCPLVCGIWTRASARTRARALRALPVCARYRHWMPPCQTPRQHWICRVPSPDPSRRQAGRAVRCTRRARAQTGMRKRCTGVRTTTFFIC